MSVRIDSVGRLHRLLMHRDGKAIVDLSAYLREVVDAVVGSLSSAEGTQFSFDLSPHYLTSPKQGVAIGLLVGEAITNALKYAHPTGVAGKIGISSRDRPEGGLVIEIDDDGVGLPEGFDPTMGSRTSLRLIRALAEQLGGRLDFEQGLIGLSVRLEVPPPASLSWAPPDAGVSAQAE
jgi:two-component sensor histidine kinase